MSAYLTKCVCGALLSLWGFFEGGCSSHTQKLPKVELSQSIPTLPGLARDSYPPEPVGDWLYALNLAQNLLALAQTYLDRSTPPLYLLANANCPSLLTPLITEPPLQRSIIARATAESVFGGLEKLGPQDLSQIQQCWEHLLQADRYFRSAGVIVAQLRQKWPDWLLAPHYPNVAYFPYVGSHLQDLPTLSFIEEERREVGVLIRACHQLVVKNPNLVPPRVR